MEKASLESISKYSVLLKDSSIKNEISSILSNYDLVSIEKFSDGYLCKFNCNDDIATLFIKKNKLSISVDDRNTKAKIDIDENMILTERFIEKRYKGYLVTDIVKRFIKPLSNSVLEDYTEKRYVFFDNRIKNILCFKEFNNLDTEQLLFTIKNPKLYANHKNEFLLHTNYFSKSVGGRYFKDRLSPVKIYINDTDVSRVYDLEDGADKIYNMYLDMDIIEDNMIGSSFNYKGKHLNYIDQLLKLNHRKIYNDELRFREFLSNLDEEVSDEKVEEENYTKANKNVKKRKRNY